MNITIPKPACWDDPYADEVQVQAALVEALKLEGDKLGVELGLDLGDFSWTETGHGIVCHVYKWAAKQRPLIKDLTETLASMKKAGWKPKSIALPVNDALTLNSAELRHFNGVLLTADHSLTSGFVIRYHEPESMR